ncbi:MAG: transcription-repair coupling factor [Planctomycetota bacterium]
MDLGKDKTVAAIISRLQTAKPEEGPVDVEGTWGSFAPLLASHIASTLKRPILYIRAHMDDADNAADDLQVFAGRGVETLPAHEEHTRFLDATDEIAAERLRITVKTAEAARLRQTPVISSSVIALCQPVPGPGVVTAGSLSLKAGEEISPEQVAAWLIDNRFERLDQVELLGQFAQRGGIIDIFAPVAEKDCAGKQEYEYCQAEAFRIEFFADNIESIRTINLDTQRSKEQLKYVNIIPPVVPAKEADSELFINTLPCETIIILDEPLEIQETAQLFLGRVENSGAYYSWSDIHRAIQKFIQLNVCRFARSDRSRFFRVNIKSVQHIEHRTGPIWAGSKAAIEQLVDKAGEGSEVMLYCENAAEVQRITEIIKESRKQIPHNFRLIVGFIHAGFHIDSLDCTIISHHEIFGQSIVRRRIRTAPTSCAVESFLDLQKGDLVVHVSHGIGKFMGIKIITRNDVPAEYLTIRYADNEILHVPVQNIALVQKYVGSMPTRPKLSKLGTKKWAGQKAKVALAVKDLASELLETQAKRRSLGGIEFNPDSTWQREFEESFPYQETADQITVAEQIKIDMQKPIPMDRLLCGDVGYGKTELAMRAAFKAVESGKQVAVLVPTTVLCVQHARTFSERFTDFPIVVETLNRFKTSKQACEILKRAREGKVDILIGTHRLLSSDVGFRDLGLLIIDEEQRFGVEHKESLKRFRVNMDVLTMTATPIPRTLHLSMLGIRDISALATAPLDRRSIETVITRYDKGLIGSAILREINRKGQVFFLHNRVRTINKAADVIKAIVPDARIAIAHGQMHKHELENTMVDFVLGEIDVLVCTTIIESGLDIPNANTILIANADRFGLSELHQLRGRVGRYKHKAYAYMLLPEKRPVTPTSAKRLKAIEEYSQLGAGFKIALRDLEIRGAGNILGPEQSGHIHQVGYEMYCRLLANAVKHLRNEPIDVLPAATIDLGFSTYIPKEYIASERQRLDIYRKIATAANSEDLKQLCSDLRDLFGPVNEQVDLLVQWAEIRILAAKHNIKSIVLSGSDLIFKFENGRMAGHIFDKAPGRTSAPDPDSIYLRLDRKYLSARTLLSVLRKMLRTT